MEDLNRFEPNAFLDAEAFKQAGLIKKMMDGIKLLGTGEITRPIVVRIQKVSKAAKEKVEAAGGKVELI